MTRKEARKTVFGLLFERDFKKDENADDIYEISLENREIERDEYVYDVYFGVCGHEAEIDGIIGKNSHGWKTERISRVARTILRIAVYEMLYIKEVPTVVSINEALDICKEFDDEKAKPFINGVLNAVKNTLEDKDENK